MATINIEMRDRSDSKGLCSLRFVLRNKGKRIFVPISVKLLPHQWDVTDQKVKNNHPQATTLNNILKLRMADLQSAIATTEIAGTVDLNKAAGRIVKKDLFKNFATDTLSRWEKTKSVNTIRAYRSMLKKVIEFSENIALQDITPDLLLKFENWCRQDGCNSPGTLKRVAFISAIIKEAIRQGKVERDPFLIYRKPKKVNPPVAYLTMDDLAKIEELLATTNSDTLRNTCIWFLFSCYSGLRYSDCQQFDLNKHIVNGRIVLYTMKTGEVVSMIITNKLSTLLPRISATPLFTNQKINQYLKAVAHLCKIDKKISFHSARHSFAIHCANLGISQEVTSKLLGHSDLKTTSIYYKIVNQRIDEEMAKWDTKT